MEISEASDIFAYAILFSLWVQLQRISEEPHLAAIF